MFFLIHVNATFSLWLPQIEYVYKFDEVLSKKCP